MTTSTPSPALGAGSERAPAPQAPAGPSDDGRVEPLFCVHVLGPDDVYAAPDRNRIVEADHG